MPSKKPKYPADSTVRRVAVLVDTSTDWGRRVITGIVSYVREHEKWQLFIEPVGTDQELTIPKGWHGDGVIARISSERVARHLKARHIPVVNVSGIHTPGPQFPRVANDVRMVAKMAADYFLERGFRNFAYVSPLGLLPVTQQRSAFVTAVEQAGCECPIYNLKPHYGVHTVDWNLSTELLAEWLKSLPKPVAILTWSGGREVIYGCQYAGLSVPEEVALLSGSDDFLCETSQIPISGVRVAGERIGYEAASLLNDLMHGESAPKAATLVPPVGVVTRQSTDTLAIADHALIQALTFIRENSEKPIQVRDAASRAGISRRVLERRFKDVLGRTPAEHIRLSHIDRARRLLSDTNLPMPDVAEAAGFGSAAYMSYIFRNELGVTPLRYRHDSRTH